MFSRYYQEELSYLRELGKEFAEAHPALAPMLSGPSADPDVERLLEGVAFLTALLRQKLEDEFPEIIHNLMALLWPHYLRPIPCCSIVAFEPRGALRGPQTVPAGVTLASVPVDETTCLFKTCYPVEIHPLKLLGVELLRPAGAPPSIRLTMELHEGVDLSRWSPGSLRFYLGGEFPRAADLYLLLREHLRKVVLRPLEGGEAAELPPSSVAPVGFEEGEGLIPYPSHAFTGYRVLQEYFVLPEKFLFLDLKGWENWRERGEGRRFEIIFELREVPATLRVEEEDFLLFCTPVVNLFPHEADPIRLDHRQTQYLVRPSGDQPEHYHVYSVDEVVGFIQGTAEERRWRPLEAYSSTEGKGPLYQLSIRESPVGEGYNVFLSVVYTDEALPPAEETLSVTLTCTNGFLPERLQVGDISIPTESSPEFATFRNVRPCTPYLLPPIGKGLLWRLLSALSLNYLSLASAEALRSLLRLFVFTEGHDRALVAANEKRVEGVKTLESHPAERLMKGVAIRGQEVKIDVDEDNYASEGDLYLFGSVLDRFLANYATINTYVRLTLQGTRRGRLYRWPARIGDRPLM